MSGGPLGEEDFCGNNYLEEVSLGNDESIIDSAVMPGNSDIQAYELCVLHGDPERLKQIEDLRRGLMPCQPPPDWYYEPV